VRPTSNRLKASAFGLVLRVLAAFTFMAASDEHLKPLRLFDLAWNGGSKMTDGEREHLHECGDCESMLEGPTAAALEIKSGCIPKITIAIRSDVRQYGREGLFEPHGTPSVLALRVNEDIQTPPPG